jgi:hypothetical protein
MWGNMSLAKNYEHEHLQEYPIFSHKDISFATPEKILGEKSHFQEFLIIHS